MIGRSRNGSALLIVLGMMSFVMVSALAFAAYMRYARLPSSYLRRTSSSRQLVKAALAEAIDDIDMAVGNNPHPGVGLERYRPSPDPTRSQPYNTWQSRVFMRARTLQGDKFGQRSAAYSDTVTPLCLEALAYIPPPLVNEARYFSRYTETARWESLDFDAGRYCYCALDVSDYFDVNRLLADSPRSSSPGRRVSMAYLFESDGHRGSGAGGQAWDDFMDKYRTLDNDTLEVTFKGKFPLVSLADLNLALGARGSVANFKSPFYEYIRNGGAGAGFYNVSSDAEEDNIRRMTFVTDGWFPSDREDYAGENAPAAVKKYDLNDGTYQPFEADYLEDTRPDLGGAVLGTRLQAQTEMQWLQKLSGIGCAALYDYLDPDHVPISLAVPTAERAPMFCGIRPVLPGCSMAIDKKMEPEGAEVTQISGDQNSRRVRKIVQYRIDAQKFALRQGDVKTTVVFPFARPDPKDDNSFTADGRFMLFFTSEDMPLRTSENDVLHLTTPRIPNTGVDPATGVIGVKLPEQGVSFSGKIDTEEAAVKEISLRLAEGQQIAPMLSSGNDLLTLTYEWTQTPKMVGGVKVPGQWEPSFEEAAQNPGQNLVKAECKIPALKKDGTVDPRFQSTQLTTLLKGGVNQGLPMKLNAAVVLRIKNSNSEFVDMVPACFNDDILVRQARVGDRRIQRLADQFAGRPYPVMRFDTGVSFTLSVQDLDAFAEKPLQLDPEGVVCADPRFNYAPEHWFKLAGQLSAQSWLAESHRKDNDRDGDIFMATSDAGYMQSPWEVAHLPRFTTLSSYGGSLAAGNLQSPSMTDLPKFPDSFAAARNSAFAWRTFDPFDVDYAAFEDLPWTSEGTGFKVNPYSDSTNVLMAAFANTPLDWKRASTNVVDGGVDYASMSASEFNKDYAWNEYNSKAKFAWSDLEAIAGRFSAAVRGNPDRGWKQAWQDMDWFGDDNRFCDIGLTDTDSIWTADRKFLYGYWRDCFQSRQQLFLIFVRAEPMMMGSGVIGQTPPQLGARAVALVWRDPSKAKDNLTPHQTRVLFYRQFD